MVPWLVSLVISFVFSVQQYSRHVNGFLIRQAYILLIN